MDIARIFHDYLRGDQMISITKGGLMEFGCIYRYEAIIDVETLYFSFIWFDEYEVWLQEFCG